MKRMKFDFDYFRMYFDDFENVSDHVIQKTLECAISSGYDTRHPTYYINQKILVTSYYHTISESFRTSSRSF